MEKFIVTYEKLESVGGSGYDSHSGMNYRPQDFWFSRAEVFNDRTTAKKFWDDHKDNAHYYKNWVLMKAQCEIIETF